MARLRSRVAVVSALGMIAAGAVTTAAVPAADAAAQAPTIKVFIGKTRMVNMTTKMHPGVHRFVVRSAKQSGFQIAQLAPGYTKREVSRDVNLSMNAQGQPNIKALKRFEKNTTLLGGVYSGPGKRGVLYVDLPAGRYIALDSNLKNETPSHLLSFTAGGRRVAGTLPQTKTIRAIKEASWAPRPKVIPAKGMLTFTNNSLDNHFIDMGKLAKGKTMADFRAWMKGGMSGPPPIDMSAGFIDSGAVSPGHTMVMNYAGRPGNWVLLCWWPDAENGGMPHAMMGMYRGITLK